MDDDLYLDGEKIPDDRLTDIFQPPPGAPAVFHRSALLVGSRGSGKTTLFRYLKSRHKGLAIHLSLVGELGSIAKKTHSGPLEFDLSSTDRARVAGKAISLLALALAGRFLQKSVSFGPRALMRCLPVQARVPNVEMSQDLVYNLWERLSAAEPMMFDGLDDAGPLTPFVEELAEAAQSSRGPLLLLLDRAELISPAALDPILRILDQSAGHVALVAIRPGIVGQGSSPIGGSAVAGDHYRVIHLGAAPRSAEWQQFTADAVAAQLGDLLESVGADLRQLLLMLSRDSVRTALELAESCRFGRETGVREAFEVAANYLRDDQLTAAQSTLQPYQPDFRSFVASVRRGALGATGKINGPVVIELQADRLELFPELGKAQRLLDLALRIGALCMPEGEMWTPGLRPRQVEIPPLFMWKRGEPFWTSVNAAPTIWGLKEQDLVKSSPRPRQPTKVFVAYRMGDDTSVGFRRRLEEMAAQHPALAQLQVLDGRVRSGQKWAEEIRKRIRQSRAVVADVTGPRPEVTFEVGFGWGLGRRIIPAVRKEEDRRPLPHWLTATQLGFYDDDLELGRLVDDLVFHVIDSQRAKLPLPPRGVPGVIAWLRDLPWNTHARSQVERVLAEEGLLPLELITLAEDGLEGGVLPEGQASRQLMRANVIIASLDGTSADPFVTFMCGALSANPQVVHGARRLARLVLILEDPDLRSPVVADSLRRCEDTVRIVQPNQLAALVRGFAKDYQAWKRPKS